MRAIRMRAAQSLIQPGVYAYDAEMTVETGDGAIVYLHNNYSDDESFTVSGNSFFDFITGISDAEVEADFLEEYESIGQATVSIYFPVFKALDAFVDDYIVWREDSGEEWLLEKEAPEVSFDHKPAKPISAYQIIAERVDDLDSEGIAYGPASIYVVEAEIETIENGSRYFYQGEWVDAAGDVILLCKRTNSVFDRQLAGEYEPDEDRDADVIVSYNTLDEAWESEDAVIYNRLYEMILECSKVDIAELLR